MLAFVRRLALITTLALLTVALACACPGFGPTTPSSVRLSIRGGGAAYANAGVDYSASGSTDQPLVGIHYDWQSRYQTGGIWSDWGSVWEDDGFHGSWIASMAAEGGGVQMRARAHCGNGFTSGWVESNALATVNCPPTKPTGVTINPATPAALAPITATAVGGTDIDAADTVSYKYRWYLSVMQGDVNRFYLQYEGATLPADKAVKGLWYLKAYSYDGTAESADLAGLNFRISNTAPTPPTAIAVTPAVLTVADNIGAAPTGGTDADGDSVSYQVQWSKHMGPFWTVWGLDGPSLDKSKLAKGQEWEVRARSFDGTTYSAWYYRVGSFFIANSAPTMPTTVVISPNSPNEDQNLIATASGSTDADAADAFQYEYQWVYYVGKREINGPATAILPASSTTPGQVWRVKARAYDGTDRSPWKASATVTITNIHHAPTAPTIYEFTVANPVEGDDLTTYVSGSTDADGDTITYEYQWAWQAAGGSWSDWHPGTATLIGASLQAYVFQVRASDGSLTSPWVQSVPLTVASIIASTEPAADAHGSGRWTGFTVTFTRPMNESEVASHLHLNAGAGEGPAVPGTLLWSVPQTKFRYKLSASLGASTQYSVNLSGGLHRADGKEVTADHGWIFFTNDAPVVTDWQPRYTNVNPGLNIVLTFDRVMNYASVKSTFTIEPVVAGTWSRSADQKTYTFNPTDNLAPGTQYTVTQGAMVRDANGVNMGAAFRWVFTTTAGAPPPPASGTVTAAAMPSGLVALTVNLSAAAEAQVEICNLAGRTVAQLAPRALQAGISTLSWNGRSATGLAVPAGTYLVKLSLRGASGATTSAVAPLQMR